MVIGPAWLVLSESICGLHAVATLRKAYVQVLFKLVMVLAGAAACSKSLVPTAITYVRRNYSDELFQMCVIGYCLTCAWICGKLGLSHELGAFLAGIMISAMPQHEDVLHSTVQVRSLSF